jgi:putative ABC transport system substrate-binding protein
LRSAENRNERLPALAAELVNLKVDVIVAADTFATSAAQKVTATIPIVMGNVSDPISKGFIKSLARPGGNITGLTNIAEEINLKQLEMLQAMVPKLTRVAVLMSSGGFNIKPLERLQAEAQKRGVTILPVEARTAQEIDKAIPSARRQNAGALLVWSSPLFNQQRQQIAALTAKHRLPAIAIDRRLPDAGVLMSYGPNSFNQFRRAATYVDKIFKGAKPADLPVEQPTIFELVINGKTAKALGLTIPQALLISANEIIK